MLGKAPTLRLAAVLMLASGVVFAMPLAGAFGMGVDATSVIELKNAGATPTFGQVWVGKWMKTYGWGGFESSLRTMRDNGVTPVIQWYYWGDDISPDCVKYGCAGRTKTEWDAMAKDMATRANAIMGSSAFYVVLEPEFQKHGIESWETFDGYLEAQAKSIRSIAPSADIVVGFGHWGKWDLFDRAVAASDLVGFQVLRGSTRDSKETAIASADYMISLAKALKARWGKSVLVFDFGVATYGGWESVQEAALDGVIAKRAELDAAGIKGIVWRYVYDNSLSSGYFGAAEKTWGVRYASGGKKPGHDELVSLIRGDGSSSTSTSSLVTAPTSTSGAFDATFTSVKVEEWWVQATVTGTASIAQVDARVNGGPWTPLTKQSWGAWARSIHVLAGEKVEFRATSTSGATDVSEVFARGGATLVASATAGFDATFSGVKVQEWWVQTSVGATQTVVKVEARVNGGTWQPLTKQTWGGWAKSIHVLVGDKVEFRATSSTGATDMSSAYYR